MSNRRSIAIRGHFATQVSMWLLVCGGFFSAQAQPVITDPPLDQLEVKLGAPVDFVVKANGTGTLLYQWRLNGVSIPGANSDILSLSRVTYDDCGIYTVAVADDKGAVTSTDARLRVMLPHVTGADFFANRYDLARGGFDLTNDVLWTENTAATREAYEPLHCGLNGTNSIWFRWTAPADGIVTFTVRGSGFDSLLAAYTGSEIGSLVEVAQTGSDDDSGGFLTSRITFNAAGKIPYSIAVDGYEGVSGDIILRWNFEPTSDHLPQILEMSPSRTVGLNDTVALPYKADIGTALWLKDGQRTTVTNDTYVIEKVDERDAGRYQVEVSQKERLVRTVLTREAILQINSTDGTCDINATAHDKFIATTGSQRKGQRGTIPGPASAGTARGYTTTQIFSTVGSTKDPGEPNHCGNPGGASEWYAYTAAATGRMHINTDGSNYDTLLAVYTSSGGFDYASLVLKACNNAAGSGNDRVRFTNAVAGSTYYIAVDGAWGASGTVRLNINLGEPPSIATQPHSQTVVQGSNLTFFVAVNGTTNFWYQWRKNGLAISGATGSSYSINNVQSSNAATYSVYISNVVDVVTSAGAVLTVTVPPQITAQPSNQTVNAGQNATFSVTATGTPILAYQWRFNGTNIAGATVPALTITNAQQANAGSYSVVVTNSAGAVTSSDATLDINLPPTVTSHPNNQTVNAGADVTFVVAVSGTSPFSYQWRFNGSNLAGETSPSLALHAVQASNSGSYSVAITNMAGSAASSNAVLTVNFAPAILVHPASQTVGLTSNVTLSVSASGNPLPAFQWRRNGTNVGANASAFTITGFQASNEGIYCVIVTNLLGSITSSNAVLMVNAPLRVGSASRTNGVFALQVIGSINSNYVLQALTDLSFTNWVSLQTNSSQNGYISFTDTNAVSFSNRFYRARQMP